MGVGVQWYTPACTPGVSGMTSEFCVEFLKTPHLRAFSCRITAFRRPLLYPDDLFLLFNLYPFPLSSSNEFGPVDLAAGDHGEIRFNAGPDCSTWVPALPKLLGKVRL